MYVCMCGGWGSCIFQRRCLTSDIDVCKIARLLLSFPKNKHGYPPACSRSQQAEHQPAAGLLPRHYLIGEGVSLPRNTERPFVLRRCPGSDIRWRLHPSGSARRRRDPARSSRPVSTKDTWRSVDPGKRWVLSPVSLPCCLGCMLFSRATVRVRVRVRVLDNRLMISHSRSCQLPHCARMGEARVDPGAAGGLLAAGDHTFSCPLLGRAWWGPQQPCVSTSDINWGNRCCQNIVI